jgi:hypothetical protein
MVNLFKDVMDPTLASIGNYIEPKIREFVEIQTNQKYISYDPFAIK